MATVRFEKPEEGVLAMQSKIVVYGSLIQLMPHNQTPSPGALIAPNSGAPNSPNLVAPKQHKKKRFIVPASSGKYLLITNYGDEIVYWYEFDVLYIIYHSKLD